MSIKIIRLFMYLSYLLSDFSLNSFGSKIIGNETNIHYNNQMDDFASPNYSCNAFSIPNHFNNYIQPGKRPVSSMVPTICLDKEKNVKLVFGGSGGTRILTSCAQVASRNLLLNESLLNCVDAPRIHNQLSPNEVLFEDGLNSVGFKVNLKSSKDLSNLLTLNINAKTSLSETE